MMRAWAWLLLHLLAGFSGRPEPAPAPDPHRAQAAPRRQPNWSLDLAAMGHRTFENIDARSWTRQQGVRFITSDAIAVYQVNEVVHASLAPRGPSGGGGNFYLQAEIIDRRDGRVVRRLRLPTNAGLTEVLPTHDGQFIVRTGDVFYLYSRNFEPVASRALPLARVTPFESWDLDRSASGGEIVLAHQQAFRDEQGRETDSKVEVKILNADTLAEITRLQVQHLLDWSADSHSIVVSDPRDISRPKFGVLGWDGKWKRMKTALEPKEPSCPYSMRALDHERLVAFGCRGLLVFSQAGDEVLSRTIAPREFFASVAGSGDSLAVKALTYQVDFLGFKTGPLSINVYDLQRKEEMFSVPLEKHNVYFDVSKEGNLAMVEGGTLKFYAAADR